MTEQPWNRNKGRYGQPGTVTLAAGGEVLTMDAGALEQLAERIEGEVLPSRTVSGELAPGMLRNFIARIERIDSEIADMRADRADVRKEAKAQGFDLGAIDLVLRRRKMDPGKVLELDAMVELYEEALGARPRHGVIDGGELSAEGGETLLPRPMVMDKADRDAAAWANGMGLGE